MRPHADYRATDGVTVRFRLRVVMPRRCRNYKFCTGISQAQSGTNFRDIRGTTLATVPAPLRPGRCHGRSVNLDTDADFRHGRCHGRSVNLDTDVDFRLGRCHGRSVKAWPVSRSVGQFGQLGWHTSQTISRIWVRMSPELELIAPPTHDVWYNEMAGAEWVCNNRSQTVIYN